MAEKNEKNSKVTAQDLLSRLNKSASNAESEKETSASHTAMDPAQLLAKLKGETSEAVQPHPYVPAEEAEPLAPDADPDGGEDVYPEDDFFDNDPIEEECSYSEPDTKEEDETTYNAAENFEQLVNEVTGEGGDTIDESDISLMVALGMEDELAKTVGIETATQITDDYVADQE